MLEAVHLGKSFSAGFGRPPGYVVRGVCLAVKPGEIVGLVGDSGSGKSTIARMLAGVLSPSEGEVRLDGATSPPAGGLWRSRRRAVQMTFQDPHLSLDPLRSIFWSMREVLAAHGLARGRGTEEEIIAALFAEVGLSLEIGWRRPGEISGGQAQRVAIARALALRPQYLIADEPTSMLDLSVQAMILRLLMHLAHTRNLGVLLISHDLDVVSRCCRRILVVRNGALMEEEEKNHQPGGGVP